MSNHKTILVVDADQAFRESMINLLLVCGVESFEIASNAEEAREKISKTSFDVILVDISMPHMNGLLFAQQLRKRMPETETILLIDDQQIAALSGGKPTKVNSPAIVKSFVHHDLPQVLSEAPRSVKDEQSGIGKSSTTAKDSASNRRHGDLRLKNRRT
jgi:CheY-like chemotaxis protein